MHHFSRIAIAMLLLLIVSTARGDDWRQFRGPDGLGISNEKNLPSEWSAKKNIAWKIKLPGAGAASPITLGNRIFVVCYSGYGMDNKAPGEMKDLRRHLLCLDRKDGSTIWAKEFEPQLPEHKYSGEGAYHGYAPSTPITDGERLYVSFGKSGVYCFDLDGKQIWHQSVGTKIHGSWGTGASPILYKNLLIVNASIESGAIVALDKTNGKEVWRAPKVNGAWNTPILVPTATKEVELVVSTEPRLMSFDPDTGKELWNADGVHRYVCPSVVAHDGVVYAIGGGHTSLAVKAGGRGDVTKTHTLWREKKGSNVGSPIFYEGHLYWASESNGTAHCQEAASGKFVYSERLNPEPGRLYASPVLADGKIYYTSQQNVTYVVAAQPKFKQLARNAFEDDKSRGNASIAVSNGQLLLRNDQYLYCIGNR